MLLTRRDLLRSAGAVGGAAAFGGLASEAVAGTSPLTRTTRAAVLVKGKPGPGGWRPVVRRDGEAYVARDDLGIRPKPGRGRRRTPVLAFAQLSDIHVIDAQSPLRFEDQEGFSSSAWRPQEILSAHVSDAMVRELNDIGRGPVTETPLAFAIQTGDNSDNSQYNEIRWNIDVLDGGEVRPDSGDLTKFEGVIDNDPDYYDPAFWHPEGTPAGKRKDVYRAKHGYPKVPGLLDACRRPFQAAGLSMPWYSVMGNHDELVQGNFLQSEFFKNQAVGSTKRLRGGVVRPVTADPDRRLISRAETVEEHFTTTGLPVGHGFTETNRTDGTAYYTFDQGLVRFIVLDTVNPVGGADGDVDDVQFAWLQEQLVASHGERLVIVASHHTSWTFTVEQRGERVVTELLKHKNVIAWVNGHTHRNSIRSHKRPTGGGFWEINTAAHIDWPQQARLIEVVDNQDRSLSIFCTMIDHGSPLKSRGLDTPRQLAGLSRLLAANDPQEREDGRRGRRRDRNVELLVRTPRFLRV